MFSLDGYPPSPADYVQGQWRSRVKPKMSLIIDMLHNDHVEESRRLRSCLWGFVIEFTDNSGTPSSRAPFVGEIRGSTPIRIDIILVIIGAGNRKKAKVFVIHRQNDLTLGQGLSKI